MTIDLIYATWPNRSYGIGWHKMAGALRDAGLTQKLIDDGHEVKEHVVSAEGEGAGELKAAFKLGGKIGRLVKASHKAGALAVIVCGSCSVAALGAVAGLGGENTGVLWMDAHADLNTPETTPSGLFDGMAAAIILGDAWQSMALDIAGLTPISQRYLCLYGARDLDPSEQGFIDDEAIALADNAEDAISALDGCEQLYIHLDMDVHNAAKLAVNRFAVKGGPSPQTVRRDLAAVAAALPVAAMAVTGIELGLGAKGKATTCAIEHIKTACAARKSM
ncbi:MAG: arginase family protein [Rhodomicrobiaceae bacterium]